MGIRLSDEEAWQALAAAHTGILTTLKADGAPVALPVWFVVHERTIGISAPSRTRKIGRVRQDPRGSFLVESGERWAELRAVHLNGRIEIVEDPAVSAAIAEALDAKYAAFRTPTEAMPDVARAHYRGRSILRLHPEGRILSWDNARLELRSER
jgi:PPOX class probable F420-dependent enzyme